MMIIDERSRHELYLRLEAVLGPEPANTLMEHLPPVGGDVATKRDLDEHRAATKVDIEGARKDLAGEINLLRKDVTGEISVLRSDFSGEINALRKDVTGEINALRKDLTGEISVLRSDFSGEINVLRREMVGIKHEILATMRAEFMSQTRSMFMAIVTVVLTMSGLVFALAR